MSYYSPTPNPKLIFTIIYITALFLSPVLSSRTIRLKRDESVVYLWPLPSEYTFGAATLSVNPDLSLSINSNSIIVTEAFERYRSIIFRHTSSKFSPLRVKYEYDISNISIVVQSTVDVVSLIFPKLTLL